MTCVTNDTALRTRCTKESVQILWGLELLLLAVQNGGIPASDAADLGQTICKLNPRLGADVLNGFLRKIRSSERGCET